MKRFVSALAICALVLTAGVANAATTRNWEGDDASNPSHFSVAANWDSGVPVCASDDDAVIQSTTGDTPVWPALNDGNRGVNDLMMRNAADLDLNNNTLFVTGIFTAEDDSGVAGASAITISNSNANEGEGVITAAQIVFSGGTSGMTIAVSGNTTVQTSSATVSCP